MKQTSLEQFNSLVDSYYLSLKRYITSVSEKKVILADYENYAWRKNPDLNPLFENPISSLLNKIDVSYSERECAFYITLHLK